MNKISALLAMSISLSYAMGPWGDHDGLKTLPAPKPWAHATKVEEVTPWSLPACAFDLFGAPVKYDMMSGAVQVIASEQMWNTSNSHKRDSVVYVVHDRIEACLDKLEKEYPEQFCVSDCLYRECDWGAGFDPEAGTCTSRYSTTLVDCTEPNYTAMCLRNAKRHK